MAGTRTAQCPGRTIFGFSDRNAGRKGLPNPARTLNENNSCTRNNSSRLTSFSTDAIPRNWIFTKDIQLISPAKMWLLSACSTHPKLTVSNPMHRYCKKAISKVTEKAQLQNFFSCRICDVALCSTCKDKGESPLTLKVSFSLAPAIFVNNQVTVELLRTKLKYFKEQLPIILDNSSWNKTVNHFHSSAISISILTAFMPQQFLSVDRTFRKRIYHVLLCTGKSQWRDPAPYPPRASNQSQVLRCRHLIIYSML